ncbi:MAG: cytochrome c biogenesis protein CcsA [Candidatus Zixiibacteriota bacterium]
MDRYMWWKILTLVAMSLMIVLSFVTPAPQQQIGEASRIFYYHTPMAWICVIAFAMAMIYSIRYLKTRSLAEDDKAVETARLGLVFCALATITGAIFAKVTWGSFWNWDPRQTSIFILLLIYGAYFALRNAVEVEERRAALAAVYAIFAFITVPFLIFVVPRVMPSLHPADSVIDEQLEFTMGATVRGIFLASLTCFVLLYTWLFSLARRISAVRRRQLEKETL